MATVADVNITRVLGTITATAIATLLAHPGAASAVTGSQSANHFDLQAHRGGVALTVENTLPAYRRALELGVSTIELDVQITKDGYAVVTHDRDPSPAKCRDTEPAFPGDPQFPYVPDHTYVKDLTLAQVETIDCGSIRQPQFPDQKLSPGARMPLLSQVFDLVNSYHAGQVHLNVETKVEAGAPEQTAPREQFVQTVAHEIDKAHLRNQVTIESFDWGSLMRMREVEPRLPIVALTNGQQFLQMGQPGKSPWLGGLDIDDFPGSLQQRFVEAAHSFGADSVSPVHGDPQGGGVDTPGYVPFTTKELVDAAHADGMTVIPWTVDDVPTMESLLDLGVDGLITDRPDVLRDLLHRRGYQLPRAYSAPS